MLDQVLQDSGAFQLAMYRLGKGVRRLLALVAEWWATRRAEDTSIAWEDGEIGKDCRK